MPQQQPQIGDDVTALMVSHEREPAKQEHPHARVGRIVKANAPIIGGLLGAAATGGASIPAQIIAASSGAVIGSRARGDSPEQARTEGLTQAATQATGAGLVKGGQTVARGLMKGTVPKNIAKEFDQVDLPGEMLNRGVVPGSARSARRVEGLSRAANAERDAAAATVPKMSPVRGVREIRGIVQKAKSGKKPEMSQDAIDYAKKSVGEMRGGGGLDGPGQLARKDILQQEGKAALNAANPRTAALQPQLADAERASIVSHLRETPRMASALDESQTMMAIDQVMKDAAHSNPVTRARVGGLTAAAMSPLGLGTTAHAVNQGSQVFNPQTIRLLELIMGAGSHQQ
jgi:hypothetical protein